MNDYELKILELKKGVKISLFLNERLIGEGFGEIDGDKGILYDVYVFKEYQRKGFGKILVKEVFKELIKKFKVKNFLVRMVMKGGQKDSLLENAGMGILVYKMGFSPQIDPYQLFSEENIKNIEIIPEKDIYPAGYQITLATAPYILTAIVLDTFSQKPQPEKFYYRFVSHKNFIEWVLENKVILGNINYYLKEENKEKFYNFLEIKNG
ncbi:MAG: GNAT family N-acetyltransferase [candidate division WOR-3 bacterium]|nr:GNAT family N-acetyltransferase [candidate division WOR-3 bacterium]MCX7837107.1 GNAT family N-acetyltransferase [candidate division WOR-3 bacterium]MDW8113981.1 GNAT family N-acetyltransferase [candidate division WOR-3 bacterium]